MCSPAVRRPVVLAVLAILFVSPAPRLRAQSLFNDDAGEFRARIERQLIERRYTELEETASRLRRERPTFLTGRPQSLDFYEALTEVKDADGRRQQRQLDDRLQHLEAWHAAQPSPTTRLVLATALRQAAWTARGSGFANTITPEAVQRMKDAVRRAEVLLKEAEPDLRDAPSADAFLYYTWMGIGVLDGYPEPRMRELLGRALACDPWFISAIDVMCQYLLPRWYGEEGDLLRLANDLTDQTREKTGEMTYAVVALSALNFGEIREPADDGFQWSRVRQGLRDWLKPASDSPYRWSLLAYWAHLADDHPTAQEAMTQLRGRWHTKVFSRQVDFLRTETWAAATPAEPQDTVVVEFGPRPLMDVVFVRNGTAFIPGTRETQVQLRSSENGSLIQTIPVDTGRVERLAADAAGPMVLFTSPGWSETRVSILDLDSGEHAAFGSQGGRISSLALSANQQYVVMGNHAGSLRRWENAERPIPFEWPSGQNQQIADLAISPDARLLATVAGHQLMVWNLASREHVRNWDAHPSGLRAIAWSPAAPPLIATAGRGNQVKLWDASEGKELASFFGGNASIESLAFTPDGKHLVGGTMSAEKPQIPGEVILWNVETRKPVKTFSGHRLGIWKVVISPDGQKIASASEDGTVRIWPVPKD